MGSECKVWLVQSIPTDMPELRQVPGVLSTGDVLRWLAGNATQKGLDVTAQYWELEAELRNPRSGEYGFSEQEMERFGASAGKAVYESLLAAADRGIPIRSLPCITINYDIVSRLSCIRVGLSTILFVDYNSEFFDCIAEFCSTRDSLQVLMPSRLQLHRGGRM